MSNRIKDFQAKLADMGIFLLGESEVEKHLIPGSDARRAVHDLAHVPKGVPAGQKEHAHGRVGMPFSARDMGALFARLRDFLHLGGGQDNLMPVGGNPVDFPTFSETEDANTKAEAEAINASFEQMFGYKLKGEAPSRSEDEAELEDNIRRALRGEAGEGENATPETVNIYGIFDDIEAHYHKIGDEASAAKVAEKRKEFFHAAAEANVHRKEHNEDPGRGDAQRAAGLAIVTDKFEERIAAGFDAAEEASTLSSQRAKERGTQAREAKLNTPEMQRLKEEAGLEMRSARAHEKKKKADARAAARNKELNDVLSRPHSKEERETAELNASGTKDVATLADREAQSADRALAAHRAQNAERAQVSEGTDERKKAQAEVEIAERNISRISDRQAELEDELTAAKNKVRSNERKKTRMEASGAPKGNRQKRQLEAIDNNIAEGNKNIAKLEDEREVLAEELGLNEANRVEAKSKADNLASVEYGGDYLIDSSGNVERTTQGFGPRAGRDRQVPPATPPTTPSGLSPRADRTRGADLISPPGGPGAPGSVAEPDASQGRTGTHLPGGTFEEGGADASVERRGGDVENLTRLHNWAVKEAEAAREEGDIERAEEVEASAADYATRLKTAQKKLEDARRSQAESQGIIQGDLTPEQFEAAREQARVARTGGDAETTVDEDASPEGSEASKVDAINARLDDSDLAWAVDRLRNEKRPDGRPFLTANEAFEMSPDEIRDMYAGRYGTPIEVDRLSSGLVLDSEDSEAAVFGNYGEGAMPLPWQSHARRGISRQRAADIAAQEPIADEEVTSMRRKHLDSLVSRIASMAGRILPGRAKEGSDKMLQSLKANSDADLLQLDLDKKKADGTISAADVAKTEFEIGKLRREAAQGFNSGIWANTVVDRMIGPPPTRDAKFISDQSKFYVLLGGNEVGPPEIADIADVAGSNTSNYRDSNDFKKDIERKAAELTGGADNWNAMQMSYPTDTNAWRRQATKALALEDFHNWRNSAGQERATAASRLLTANRYLHDVLYSNDSRPYLRAVDALREIGVKAEQRGIVAELGSSVTERKRWEALAPGKEHEESTDLEESHRTLLRMLAGYGKRGVSIKKDKLYGLFQNYIASMSNPNVSDEAKVVLEEQTQAALDNAFPDFVVDGVVNPREAAGTLFNEGLLYAHHLWAGRHSAAADGQYPGSRARSILSLNRDKNLNIADDDKKMVNDALRELSSTLNDNEGPSPVSRDVLGLGVDHATWDNSNVVRFRVQMDPTIQERGGLPTSNELITAMHANLGNVPDAKLQGALRKKDTTDGGRVTRGGIEAAASIGEDGQLQRYIDVVAYNPEEASAIEEVLRSIDGVVNVTSHNVVDDRAEEPQHRLVYAGDADWPDRAMIDNSKMDALAARLSKKGLSDFRITPTRSIDPSRAARKDSNSEIPTVLSLQLDFYGDNASENAAKAKKILFTSSASARPGKKNADLGAPAVDTPLDEDSKPLTLNVGTSNSFASQNIEGIMTALGVKHATIEDVAGTFDGLPESSKQLVVYDDLTPEQETALIDMLGRFLPNERFIGVDEAKQVLNPHFAGAELGESSLNAFKLIRNIQSQIQSGEIHSQDAEALLEQILPVAKVKAKLYKKSLLESGAGEQDIKEIDGVIKTLSSLERALDKSLGDTLMDQQPADVNPSDFGPRWKDMETRITVPRELDALAEELSLELLADGWIGRATVKDEKGNPTAAAMKAREVIAGKDGQDGRRGETGKDGRPTLRENWGLVDHKIADKLDAYRHELREFGFTPREIDNKLRRLRNRAVEFATLGQLLSRKELKDANIESESRLKRSGLGALNAPKIVRNMLTTPEDDVYGFDADLIRRISEKNLYPDDIEAISAKAKELARIESYRDWTNEELVGSEFSTMSEGELDGKPVTTNHKVLGVIGGDGTPNRIMELRRIGDDSLIEVSINNEDASRELLGENNYDRLSRKSEFVADTYLEGGVFSGFEQDDQADINRGSDGTEAGARGRNIYDDYHSTEIGRTITLADGTKAVIANDIMATDDGEFLIGTLDKNREVESKHLVPATEEIRSQLITGQASIGRGVDAKDRPTQASKAFDLNLTQADAEAFIRDIVARTYFLSLGKDDIASIAQNSGAIDNPRMLGRKSHNDVLQDADALAARHGGVRPTLFEPTGRPDEPVYGVGVVGATELDETLGKALIGEVVSGHAEAGLNAANISGQARGADSYGEEIAKNTPGYGSASWSGTDPTVTAAMLSKYQSDYDAYQALKAKDKAGSLTSQDATTLSALEEKFKKSGAMTPEGRLAWPATAAKMFRNSLQVNASDVMWAFPSDKPGLGGTGNTYRKARDGKGPRFDAYNPVTLDGKKPIFALKTAKSSGSSKTYDVVTEVLAHNMHLLDSEHRNAEAQILLNMINKHPEHFTQDALAQAHKIVAQLRNDEIQIPNRPGRAEDNFEKFAALEKASRDGKVLDEAQTNDVLGRLAELEVKAQVDGISGLHPNDKLELDILRELKSRAGDSSDTDVSGGAGVQIIEDSVKAKIEALAPGKDVSDFTLPRIEKAIADSHRKASNMPEGPAKDKINDAADAMRALRVARSYSTFKTPEKVSYLGEKRSILDSSFGPIVNPVSVSPWRAENDKPVGTGKVSSGIQDRYPENYQMWKDAVLNGELSTGGLLINDLRGFDAAGKPLPDGKVVVNLPTHGKNQNTNDKDSISMIISSLRALVEYANANNLESITIPELGRGIKDIDFESHILPHILAAARMMPDTSVNILYDEPDGLITRGSSLDESTPIGNVIEQQNLKPTAEPTPEGAKIPLDILAGKPRTVRIDAQGNISDVGDEGTGDDLPPEGGVPSTPPTGGSPAGGASGADTEDTTGNPAVDNGILTQQEITDNPGLQSSLLEQEISDVADRLTSAAESGDMEAFRAEQEAASEACLIGDPQLSLFPEDKDGQ